MLICFALFSTLNGFFSLPLLAPTTEVKLLGASAYELGQLENFTTYEVGKEINDDQIRAASYLVIDLSSGRIVAKRRSENPLPIASLTKLMTVYTTLSVGEDKASYTVRKDDLESISPTLNLSEGDIIAVDDLIKSVLIGSANDAALALAGYVEEKSGQPYENIANQLAKELGMKNSRFSNPTGFDSSTNYSSATDVSILVEALMEKKAFEGTWRRGSYGFAGIKGGSYHVEATNKLIAKHNDLKAIKTGFTNLALGSMVNVLENGDLSYLLIVIGSPDREGDTLMLRNQILERN